MSTPTIEPTQGNLSARERRLYPQPRDNDESKADKLLRWKDGPLFKGVTISGTKMTIDFSRAYPDDVLATIRDMLLLLNKPVEDEDTTVAIEHINQAIYAQDRRAVKIHGYERNQSAKNLLLPYE